MDSVPKGVLSALPVLLAATILVYGVGLLMYRLYFRPLAKFLCLKLAAVMDF
jgi:hypothetical protein